MSANASQPQSGTSWLKHLASPAVGNACAALGLIVAIAAGIGVLRDELFWLVLSYALLVGAVVFMATLARRRSRVVRDLEAEEVTLRRALSAAGNALARTRTELAAVREDVEACERGYASLRAAVIQTAHSGGPDMEDFDEEVSDALRRLGRVRA